jgi:3-hydroxybutyryl-CoA dehydratase
MVGDREPLAALNGVQIGDVLHLPMQFGEQDMNAFAALSGDHNVLHHDEAYARARGFSGRVVYGGLLIAAISRLLGERLVGNGCVWQSLELQFRSALHVDEPAQLTARVEHVSEAVGAVQVRLEIRSGERRIASGSAQAMVARVRA